MKHINRNKTIITAAVILGASFGINASLTQVASKAASGVNANADWAVYGGQAENQHYSPLIQINRSNVSKLKVAWTYDTGEEGILETNPVVVGRVLYAYTPSQKVIALDAVTGKLLWKFDAGVKAEHWARGVSYWTDGQESRIFAGVMNDLYALDPKTGKPVPSFGENGKVDLRKNLRGDFNNHYISMDTPGVVYKNLIIVGGEMPETLPAAPGDIRAYDVRTGELRWSFHTIPHPGEFGYDTWPKDAWKTSGAANNWAGMSLDAARGIVYVPTGSAAFDFYGANRIGNDLFADTLLALDANTGQRIWHFQDVHHDLWDRDFPSAPALLTVVQDGKQIDAIAQTTKTGYLYLFDRSTGKPLFPIEEQAYPASTVPGEVASPTQPRPLKPAPYARQFLTEDLLTNRTPEAHAWALENFRTFRSEGLFVPFGLDKQTVLFPGFDGGAEWGGPAVDPKTGVIYINSNDVAWTGGLVADKPARTPGEAVYRSQCSICHGTNRSGSPPSFPSLIGISARISDAQITATVRQGKGRMPTFPNVSETQLQSLLRFLKEESVTGKPEQTSDKQEAASLPGGATSDPRGAALYQKHCAICHGDSREGIPPSFPMLIGVGQRLSTEQITSLIHQGRGRMPAIPKLQSGELDPLLRYLGVSDVAQAASNQEPQYSFTGYRRFVDPDHYPAVAPPWGTLSAIDLNTGNYLWKIPFGEYPALVAKGLKNTGSENYGGPVVTASGLLFIGATVFDHKFRAFDSHTGKLLWETQLPYAGRATPATYMVDGKQYVVLATGAVRFDPAKAKGVYVAFSLP